MWRVIEKSGRSYIGTLEEMCEKWNELKVSGKLRGAVYCGL